MAAEIALDQDVMLVLGAADISANALRLIGGQLDRKLYERVDKVLTAAGGKWNRKVRAHVFDGDAGDIIEGILLTGSVRRVKQDLGQFDSPPAVVERLLTLADVRPAMAVLEPSVGIGNIAVALEARGAEVAGIEIDVKRHGAAADRCLFPHGLRFTDFLSVPPQPVFDRVVMNPPFAKQADIQHVKHAAKFLRDGGRLVSVMSAGTRFRTDARPSEFRAFVAKRNGTFEDLPDGAFSASGTNIRACMVAITIDASQAA